MQNKKIFTLVIAAMAVIGSISVNAQNDRRIGEMKPEIRHSESKNLDDPLQLRAQIETRADSKPFPDSTVTYNLKGEPIGKSYYVYNAKGDLVSYKAYVKQSGTNNWTESARRNYTYDSAGKRLSGEAETWDETKKVWVGNYKYTSKYDSQGREIFYEEYSWDSQNNTWKGRIKYTVDFVNGNRRTISYEWDAGSWVPSQRTEYVSSILSYNEYWNSSENKWGTLQKVQRKATVLDYNKFGLHITIIKMSECDKLDNGGWSEEWEYYSYEDGRWNTWGFTEYDISYDNAGNISSVNTNSNRIFTFTYDYAVNKMNSYKFVSRGEVLEYFSDVYDEQGRIIESITHLDYKGEKRDTKYAYTYVGNSNVQNSIEYYLWDNSKNVFVKQSKNMYIENENGQNTMYQTYSWAETKWVLSSYTIYYPNDYTSSLEFEETGTVGQDNRGTFEVGFNLPQDAEVTGSFYITFPKGFVLDEKNTVLSEALSAKYSITVTRQGNENTWFVEIKELPLRSMSSRSASSYKKILTVAYSVEAETKKGTYTAEIKNLNLVLSDGTILIEQNRNISVTVDRWGVSNEQIGANIPNAYVTDNTLYIQTLQSETVTVYTAAGVKLYESAVQSGTTAINATAFPQGVLIVKGSSGWVRKVML